MVLKMLLNVVLNLVLNSISLDYILILQIVQINFRFHRNTKKHDHPIRHENTLIAHAINYKVIFLQKKVK